MKSKYLFPHRFKRIGLFIMTPTAVLGLYMLGAVWEPEFLNFKVPAFFVDNLMFGENHFFAIIEDNLLNEILGALMIIGSLMVAFSKEKEEDEFIASIRLESLVWATYVNYGVLLISLFLIYTVSFFFVMIINMFTILLFFILRFNLILWKSKKGL